MKKLVIVKFGFGVDIDNNFKPDYVTIKGKKKVIDELKKEVKKTDFVYLATDPDREGEAISWHLYDVLGLDKDHYDRIVFNEITKNAILDSFNHARKIDQDLVNSQETRRILDRIIGFRLSKLIQNKTSGSSAGRVQSVALKLIVDKEREIEAFIPEEYWSIKALFNDFEADLFGYKDKKLEIKTEFEANTILDKLSNSFEIESVDKKSKKKQSKAPFTTSTLQQAASNLLNFSAKKTMQVAQKLYEGIELEDETVGLISYMRTDSIRLSNDFISDTLKYIEGKYGKDYVGSVKVSKKTENVQDAHEAIRPTSIKRDPVSVKPYLTNDEFNTLFNLSISPFSTNLSHNSSSSLHLSITYLITYLSSSSSIFINPSKSQKAISGSIIQNSLACVLVFDFSDLNVGPNVYIFLNAIANASP